MTVPAYTVTRVQIAGDGTTSQITIPFHFVDQTDLRVIHTDAAGTDTIWVYQQSPGSWSYTGGNNGPGTVNFTASDLQTGQRLTVVRISEYKQGFSLTGEIDPVVIENALDAMALSIHAIAGRSERSLAVSASLEGALPSLEVPDLPENHGFMRKGDALVPVPIDSEFIKQNADAAAASASAASTSETNASNSETKANKWADEEEDVPVETSPDKFSAKHWAAKAQQGVASPVIVQADKPGTPTTNATWYQTRTGKLYLWYKPAAVGQWVQINHDKAASVAQDPIVFPTSPSIGQDFTPNVGGVTYRCISTEAAQWDVLPDTDLENQVVLNTANIATNTANIGNNASAITALQDLRWTYVTPVVPSGTAIDFTGIPAGVTDIEVFLEGVSFSANDDFLLQIGVSGAETSGYDSISTTISTGANVSGTASTAGFLLRRNNNDPGNSLFKLFRLNAVGTKWQCAHGGLRGGVNQGGFGSKTISGELGFVRLTRAGSATINGTAVHMRYHK